VIQAIVLVSAQQLTLQVIARSGNDRAVGSDQFGLAFNSRAEKPLGQTTSPRPRTPSLPCTDTEPS
jgi:hypothetical protein